MPSFLQGESVTFAIQLVFPLSLLEVSFTVLSCKGRGARGFT
jgi:hypothetical protein